MTVQLGLEGMPRRLFACTPSRLTTWLDCPRRYRLTYLDRPAPARGGPWAHSTLGATVHLALARWWAEPLDRRTPAVARALLERAWTADGFADDAQSARWRGRAGDMVAAYVAGIDPADEPVGVERTVSTRSAALAVSGRVDRIDQRGEELVVVDDKTGRAVAHDHTEQSLARHLARAEAIGEEAVAAAEALLAGGDPQALFPARPGSRCGWCDHVRSCVEGAAAGPRRRPWEGLADEPADEIAAPEVA